MKTILTLAALAGFLHAIRDTPAPVPYEPPMSSDAATRAWLRGDADTLDDTDLENATPALRAAASLLN
jgi:hypothetical protein